MSILMLRSSIVAGGGAAFDYYISPTGSDSNDGLTTSTPWAITAINTKRATYAGLSVGLMDGTYNISAMAANSGGYSPALEVGAGSSGSPTIIQSVNPRMAIIDDTGNSSLIRAMIGSQSATAGYFHLVDLKIRGALKMCVHVERITSGRAAGIRIDGCEIYDQSYGLETDLTIGLFFEALDDAVVTNCYFHDIVNTLQASSAAGFQMYGCKRTIIEYCTFSPPVNCAVHDKYAGGNPRTDQQETQVRYCYFNGNPIACWGFDNKDQTGPPPSNPPYGPYIIENNVFENCGQVLSNAGAFSASVCVGCARAAKLCRLFQASRNQKICGGYGEQKWVKSR